MPKRKGTYGSKVGRPPKKASWREGKKTEVKPPIRKKGDKVQTKPPIRKKGDKVKTSPAGYQAGGVVEMKNPMINNAMDRSQNIQGYGYGGEVKKEKK